MPPLPKTTLRVVMKERRESLSKEAPEIAQDIIPSFFAHIPLSSDMILGAYWPIGSEVDTRPLLHALLDQNIVCGLPCVARGEMIFRRWDLSTSLVRKGGILEPEPSSPPVTPMVLLVPLLAFDRRGHRLGYGKGHYDRYLHHTPVLTVGLGFQGQEVASIPQEPHDIPLDFILTEKGLFPKKSAE